MAKKKTAAGRTKKAARKVATKKSAATSATKKTARKPKKMGTRAKKKSSKTASAAAAEEVTIRMYCQGLGDCFLLRLPGVTASSKPVHVMIDCGVIIGTRQASEKMSQVVDDIIATTEGKIDLLVVTHEHWDHLSGFVQVAEKFNAIEFGSVWLAWTEQPGHPVADKLRRERQARLRSLRAALAGLQAAGGLRLSNAAKAELAAAEHVLDFFGPPTLAGAGLAAASRNSTAAAMQYVASLGAEFLSPGNVKSISGTNVQAYVLGPPLDEKLLKKDAPSRGKDQAYELLAALAAIAEADGSPSERDAPFATRYQVSAEQARHDPFFRGRYGFADDPLGPAGTAWQRIDEVWLQGVSQLALKLDSDTNNTSLVLAFELPDGRTLIFPGDAQIGNWLSWRTIEFPHVGERAVTSQELLSRAVVYKVGHHGSHNATLKSGGLEAMTSGDLVAMIPVNEAMAKKKRPPRTGWKMPFNPLYDRLRSITAERVLRADRGASELDEVGQDVPPDQRAKWQQFRQHVRFSSETLLDSSQPLYVEYSLT